MDRESVAERHRQQRLMVLVFHHDPVLQVHLALADGFGGQIARIGHRLVAGGGKIVELQAFWVFDLDIINNTKIIMRHGRKTPCARRRSSHSSAVAKYRAEMGEGAPTPRFASVVRFRWGTPSDRINGGGPRHRMATKIQLFPGTSLTKEGIS